MYNYCQGLRRKVLDCLEQLKCRTNNYIFLHQVRLSRCLSESFENISRAHYLFVSENIFKLYFLPERIKTKGFQHQWICNFPHPLVFWQSTTSRQKIPGWIKKPNWDPHNVQDISGITETSSSPALSGQTSSSAVSWAQNPNLKTELIWWRGLQTGLPRQQEKKLEFQMWTKYLFPSYYSDALHLYASAVMSLRQNGFQLNNIKGKDVIGEIWNRPYNGSLGKWWSSL